MSGHINKLAILNNLLKKYPKTLHMKELTASQIEKIKKFQKNEITEYHIYSRLAKTIKDANNAKVILNIGEDELIHYNFWKSLSKTEVKPNKWKIFIYFWIIRIFGLTFGIRLMERGEDNANEYPIW